MYLGWVWLAQKNAAEASFQTKALYTLLNWAIVNYTHTRTQALLTSTCLWFSLESISFDGVLVDSAALKKAIKRSQQR